ncbi:hypothetical protein THAOC_21616 [Thalassiosira oceanica]|uniref:Uncharacterized protein n=1 Tax=Thalassiosira oceanica TaxID=159749 RepID=K0SBJ0_THAOC|nr:hypothetical protein THAOC_21616 [Thalassiosira oceanica]|eukprot:EJK58276.1 hypothetical protein THAOC_21616 [Thalassiosira oceanica]
MRAPERAAQALETAGVDPVQEAAPRTVTFRDILMKNELEIKVEDVVDGEDAFEDKTEEAQAAALGVETTFDPGVPWMLIRHFRQRNTPPAKIVGFHTTPWANLVVGRVMSSAPKGIHMLIGYEAPIRKGILKKWTIYS